MWTIRLISNQPARELKLDFIKRCPLIQSKRRNNALRKIIQRLFFVYKKSSADKKFNIFFLGKIIR